jgi:ABC-2 type transport system permease protein
MSLALRMETRGGGKARRRGDGFIEAMHAEWTKQRTVAGPAWLLGTIAVLTASLGTAVVAATSYQASGSYQDTTKLALSGVILSQSAVAVLAVLTISNEYSTGLIRITLAATPRRLHVLVAKAGVLTGGVLVAGTVGVLGSLLAARLLLPGNGFTTAHGYTVLSLAHGATVRAAAGSVLYLALIGLLSLGVATVIRDSATAIGIVLGLLYLFPILVSVVSDTHWHRHLEQIGPMSAGLSIQATVDLHSLAISPWAGLGVLAAWAAGALLAAGLLLCRRDA